MCSMVAVNPEASQGSSLNPNLNIYENDIEIEIFHDIFLKIRASLGWAHLQAI